MLEDQKIKIDLRDKEILYQLDLNARQSNSQMAKKLRLNKNVVNYRINRLEKLGVIRGYSTIVNFSKLGFFLFRVYIDFYEFSIAKENELIDYLSKEDLVGNLIRTIGDWDVVADFYVRKINDFQTGFLNFLNEFKGIIKTYDVELVIKDEYLSRKYLVKNEKISDSSLEVGGNAPERLDKKDIELINLLIKNARIPIIELASKLKMTSTAVLYRIKQLKNKRIILGYKTNLNISKMNYARYRLNFELNDTTIINDLISYCKHNPNIILIIKAISDNTEFKCDIESDNFDKVINFVNNLKKQFHGKIRNYKYIRFVEYYKNYEPPLDNLYSNKQNY